MFERSKLRRIINELIKNEKERVSMNINMNMMMKE